MNAVAQHLVDGAGLADVLPAADLHPVHEQELPRQDASQVHLRATTCLTLLSGPACSSIHTDLQPGWHGPQDVMMLHVKSATPSGRKACKHCEMGLGNCAWGCTCF